MPDRILSIDGYLTERKLSNALHEITQDAWLGGQLKVPGTRMRWDMAFTLGSTTVVVEYDGDEHYRNALKIKTDIAKDQAAVSLGYKTVRFPYWIQLDTTTLEHFSGLEANVRTDFPHGFITTRIFPASFCGFGIQRFAGELDALPGTVRDSVIQSLQDRASKHGIEWVLPQQLFHLLSADTGGVVSHSQ